MGGERLGNLTRREFYGETYESTGKEVCLWWLRLLSWKDPSGVCLHDLFEWDGKSSLWYTDLPSLHPDKGLFPRVMVAVQVLKMFHQGEVSRVRILGDEAGLEKVLADNGVECEVVAAPPCAKPHRSPF